MLPDLWRSASALMGMSEAGHLAWNLDVELGAADRVFRGRSGPVSRLTVLSLAIYDQVLVTYQRWTSSAYLLSPLRRLLFLSSAGPLSLCCVNSCSRALLASPPQAELTLRRCASGS
ncbi:hypothetical protein PENSPDRAFT_281579 [Peniophora sp. CONT]|nr:hypothetical protein PENSPDRAFT_281579 [Peniophora sp. CONT]